MARWVRENSRMQMEAVLALAREAHAGQRDKVGRDYFEAHVLPIAAGASLFGETAEQAAVLHDVLEDTELTAADLLARGVGPEVVAAVESVTRREGETYDGFITRAARHPVGKLVKLVDNAWNIMSNPELAEQDPEKAQQLLEERYLPARDRLLASIGINQCWLGYVELQSLLEAEHQALTAV